MAGYRIRRAVLDDVRPIARLHLASYRDAYRGILPPGFLAGFALADQERRWFTSIGDPARVTLIAEDRAAQPAPATCPCLLRAGRLDSGR